MTPELNTCKWKLLKTIVANVVDVNLVPRLLQSTNKTLASNLRHLLSPY